MTLRRVLVIGNSLFAETLAQMLAHATGVVVVGTAPTLDTALPLIDSACPDVLILAACTSHSDGISNVLISYPHLPILWADLDTNEVQLITSRSISARREDLLAMLDELPPRC